MDEEWDPEEVAAWERGSDQEDDVLDADVDEFEEERPRLATFGQHTNVAAFEERTASLFNKSFDRAHTPPVVTHCSSRLVSHDLPLAGADDELDLYYDDSGYYGYVLLRRANGELTDSDRRSVEAILRSAVRVVRGGQSHHPAGNGVQYDWYYRVQGPGGAKPDHAVVDHILEWISPPGSSHTPGSSAASPQANDRTLQQRLELEQRIAVLEARLGDERVRVTKLGNELERATKALDLAVAQEEKLKRRLKQAEEDLVRRLRQASNSDHDDALRAELEAVSTHLAESLAKLDEERRRSQEFVETFDRENAQLRSERDALEDRVRELGTALTAADEARGQLENQLIALRDNLARAQRPLELPSLLTAVLPSVELLSGSFDVLLTELPDYHPVLRVIGRIVTDGVCPGGQRKVRSAGPWIETRYRTGQANDGRLYFARKSSAPGWKMLVSRKQQQRADIRRLKSERV